MISIPIPDVDTAHRVIGTALERGQHVMIGPGNAVVFGTMALAAGVFVKVALEVAERNGEREVTWSHCRDEYERDCIFAFLSKEYAMVLYGLTEEEFCTISGIERFDKVH